MSRQWVIRLAALALLASCISGKDRPNDGGPIQFADQSDGLPSLDLRGGARDGAGRDGELDHGALDTRADQRARDVRVDRLRLDLRVDTLPRDASVDTLSPDTRVDTLSPDASVDILSPDTTADLTHDLPSPDAASAAGCVETADSATLLLFTFTGSGTSIEDVAGSHDGALSSTTYASRASGAAGCGVALDFYPTSSNNDYVTVPNSPEWNLTSGSVDLWVNLRSYPSPQAGIVSRDAMGNNEGSFTLYQVCDGSLVVRLETGNERLFACSTPVTLDAWHHVGVNFGAGGLELFVDGKPGTRTGTFACNGFSYDCGVNSSKGLLGNANPWVVGGSGGGSQDGAATPVYSPLDGMVDSLRISSIRRVF